MKKCCGLFFLCCMLCSCTIGSATHDAITNATKSVDALSVSITPECMTVGIEKQINNIKKQIESIKPICENDLAVERADKNKWKVAFFALLGIVVFYLFGKIK